MTERPTSGGTSGGPSGGPVAGAVLTGGVGRRMGRGTKALVKVDGVAMARRVADALIAAGCEPVAFVGGDPTEIGALGLPVVADEFPGEGPLGGIITALRAATGPVLVVACDLPFLTPELVGTLLAAAAAGPDRDVVVARTDRVEPGCAIWMPSSMESLSGSFRSGERAVHRVLHRLRCAEVAVPAAPLQNVNTPGDLEPRTTGRIDAVEDPAR